VIVQFEQVRPRYSIPPHIRQRYLDNLPEQACSICLNTIDNDNTIELTECGHLFHINCLRTHRNNSDNCPVCRFNFSG